MAAVSAAASGEMMGGGRVRDSGAIGAGHNHNLTDNRVLVAELFSCSWDELAPAYLKLEFSAYLKLFE